MKILIVSTMPTHPTDAGNRAAMMAQVNVLKEMGNKVHFLFVCMELRHTTDYKALEDYWGEKLHLYNMCAALKAKRVLTDKWRSIFCNNHWKVDDHYPWGVADYINKLNETEEFDACIIQYYRLSRLVPQINIPRKAIFTHDVFSYKDIRVDGRFYETLNAHEEAKAMQRCPYIFSIQQQEAAYFGYLSPKSKVLTVYNPYTTHNQPLRHNRTLLYLASRMKFNVTGMQWFLDNVWPLLKEKNIQLIIGGTVCEELKVDDANIHLLGRVDSLEEFYANGDIVINPVYQGTGLKIKTFEALSYGKATIVHPHSMTGIFDQQHAPLFSAEEPQKWVEVIEQLLANPQEVERMHIEGLEYINRMNDYIKTQYDAFLNGEVSHNS